MSELIQLLDGENGMLILKVTAILGGLSALKRVVDVVVGATETKKDDEVVKKYVNPIFKGVSALLDMLAPATDKRGKK
jgi:hypothetical protein